MDNEKTNELISLFKEIIYRSYTIKSNYIKLNDCFKFGYDLLDSELNPLIRFNTFDQAVSCVDRLSKWLLIIFYMGAYL